MAMVKYLVNHGNTAVLLLDRPIRELLNLGDVGDYVKVRTDGKKLFIEGIKKTEGDEKCKE